MMTAIPVIALLSDAILCNRASNRCVGIADDGKATAEKTRYVMMRVIDAPRMVSILSIKKPARVSQAPIFIFKARPRSVWRS